MITITMPIWLAIAMTIWFTLDIVVRIAEAIVDKKEKKLEIELEKIVRGIK